MKKIILLLALVFTAAACSSSDSENTIKKSGIVEAKEITATAKVGGTLEKLLKKEGEKVSKGDTVAILDSKITRLQLEKAKAMLRIAEAKLSLLKKGARKEDLRKVEENLKQAQISFDLAKKEFKRARNLLKDKSIPQSKFDEAKSKFELAKSRLNQAKSEYRKIKKLFRPEEIEQAKASVDASKAEIEILKENLNNSVILSPADGIISNIFYDEGETVIPYGNVFEVENLAKPEIRIYVSETELGKVKVGQKAKISCDSFEEKSFDGVVTYISPIAEFTPKTIQTEEERVKLVFEIKIEADNPKYELKSGMPVDVLLQLK